MKRKEVSSQVICQIRRVDKGKGINRWPWIREDDDEWYSMKQQKCLSSSPMKMFNNHPSIPLLCNSSSLQSYVWIPIKRNRYPSTITWQQIKRQQQLRYDGKANSVDYGEIIDEEEDDGERTASQQFFNYRLSMASSVMLFFEYIVCRWIACLLRWV